MPTCRRTGRRVSRCHTLAHQASRGPRTAWLTAWSTAARRPSAAGVTRQALPAARTMIARPSQRSVAATTATVACLLVIPPTSTPATRTPTRILGAGLAARAATAAAPTPPKTTAAALEPGQNVSRTAPLGPRKGRRRESAARRPTVAYGRPRQAAAWALGG